jgi:tetratricopeptide (TPR) repeat protein
MSAAVFDAESIERLREVQQAVYSLDYARAQELCRRMISAAPEDPAGYVLLARTHWLEELASEQQLSIDRFASSDFFAETPRYKAEVSAAARARFRSANGEAIERAKTRVKNRPDDLAGIYLLGLAYQNLASFEASLEQNWWASARSANHTLRYHRQVIEREQGFVDARLASGVYSYVAASLPWKIKWLSILLGYRGDKARAFQELETVAQKAVLVSEDARTILVLLYTRERNYAKAREHLAALGSRYPANYLVQLDLAGLSLRMNRLDDALTIYRQLLERIQERKSRLDPAVVYNRMGSLYRVRKDLAAAASWFERTLGHETAPVRLKTVARLELAKTLDLMGRRAQAIQLYEAVRASEDVAGTRREAARWMESPYREPGD